MTKAFGYLRVSGTGQIDGDGLVRQRDKIEKYAAAHDIEIVEWFTDGAVKGKTELENRPGLAALLDRVESNGVRIVIIEIADRLARDIIVSEIIIRQFIKAQCKIILADGGMDLTAGDDSNPTAKLVRQILGAVAEFDRCIIVLKLRAARDRIRRNGGRCEGKKPYGAKPGESQLLERIKEMRQHKRMGQIADQLNSDAVPTRSGKPWKPAMVAKILRKMKAKESHGQLV